MPVVTVPLGEGEDIGLTFPPAGARKHDRKVIQKAKPRDGVIAIPALQDRIQVLWGVQEGDACLGVAWWCVGERLVGNYAGKRIT